MRLKALLMPGFLGGPRESRSRHLRLIGVAKGCPKVDAWNEVTRQEADREQEHNTGDPQFQGR